jgi:hypothetical protein
MSPGVFREVGVRDELDERATFGISEVVQKIDDVDVNLFQSLYKVSNPYTENGPE